jgi:hypothetical protein
VTDSDEDAEAFMKDVFKDAFEMELSGWVVDDEMWPKHITYELFLDGFDVEYHSMIFDSLKYDIQKKA